MFPQQILTQQTSHFTPTIPHPLSKIEIPKYFLYVRHTSYVQKHHNQHVLMGKDFITDF